MHYDTTLVRVNTAMTVICSRLDPPYLIIDLSRLLAIPPLARQLE